MNISSNTFHFLVEKYKFEEYFFIIFWKEENLLQQHSSVQFSSIAQSCPTLCDPMNHSMPGFPVHH